MRRIGQKPLTQSNTTSKTDTTSSVESTKQKTVQQEKEQQQQQQQTNTQPLNEGVKGQRRMDKQYSGLMKQIMVKGQNPGQTGNSGWQRGVKPGEKPQQTQGTQQTNQQGQGWVKATPTKGNVGTTNQQPGTTQNQGLTGAPKQQPPNPEPLGNQRPQRLFQKPLVGTPKEQVQNQPPLQSEGKMMPTRQRAMGHGQSTLPELSIDQRKQIQPSNIDSRMTGVQGKQIDVMPGLSLPDRTQQKWNSYRNEIEKPLPNNSEGRQLQFQKAHTSLEKLEKTDKQDRPQIQQEKMLLQQTMQDKNLVNSPYVSSVNHAMELKRLGLPPTVAGQVGKFQDTRLEGDMKELGKGGINTVYSGTYRLPNNQGTFQGVYKPEGKENTHPLSENLGIDQKNPRFGYRNVATTRLDQELGFGITTRTEMGMHNNRLGTVQEKAQGTTYYGGKVPGGQPVLDDQARSMRNELRRNGIPHDDNNWAEKYNEFATKQGLPSSSHIGLKDGKVHKLETQAHDLNFGDPNLRKDLVRLQMTDYVSGQVDRHGGNYMVNRDNKGNYLGLKGIDNDLSWGKNFNSMKDVGLEGSGGRLMPAQGYNNPIHLPPVVDRETFDAFKRLTPQTFSNKMGGLLTQDEMNSAGNRLRDLHGHLDTLEKNGRVINSNEWGSQKVTDWLMEKKGGEHTNFVARDKEFQDDRRKFGLIIPFTPKN